MGKYENDVKRLLDLIGGKANIQAVSHCMTRMRFVLVDPKKADEKAIEELPSVKGTFTQAGQYQVIIGNDVSVFYNEFTAYAGIEGVSKDAVKAAAKTNQNPLQKIMGTLGEIFAPLIPALICGGLVLGFRNVIGEINFFNNGTESLADISQFWAGTYNFLWLIGEAVFHLLPVGIVWSITKKMGTTQILGIILGLAIVFITQYYTGDHKPVKSIAESSETGPATNVIQGISIGLESTVLPVVCIVVAIIATYLLGYVAAPEGADAATFGLYGTAIGTIAMLGSSAFILAMDTFGPITDNGGGIAEMSNQPSEVRDRTDKLDSAGNTTKALTKGYAMASAALAAFLLFAAFFEIVAEVLTEKTGITHSITDVMVVDIGDPLVFVGGLVGAVLVFFFASLAIRAVSKAAGEMIEEVRRQFREDPGIMAGTSKPDTARCVDIATRGALKAMVLPALLPIVVPIAFGLIYRYCLTDYVDAYVAVGALIMVGTIVGILMANFLNNGGGAWDNAKKYIEEGNHGGKGSPAHAAAVVGDTVGDAHAAAVVGDTVGDPFKDTAGPSIHVLVKLLSTICLVTAVLFIA